MPKAGPPTFVPLIRSENFAIEILPKGNLPLGNGVEGVELLQPRAGLKASFMNRVVVDNFYVARIAGKGLSNIVEYIAQRFGAKGVKHKIDRAFGQVRDSGVRADNFYRRFPAT